MKLYTPNNQVTTAYKTKKPKFAHCFGRTWDLFRITIDEKEYEFWADTTWGFNYYFLYKDNRWYKLHLLNPININDVKRFFTKRR